MIDHPLIMYRNQIDLSHYGLEKNTAFMKGIMEARFEDEKLLFFRKEPDERRLSRDFEAGPESFMECVKNGASHIKLQLGSPLPEDELRYFCSKTSIYDDRAFEMLCPYTEENFEKLNALFENSFGENIENIPIPKVLEEMHRTYNF